MNYYIQLIPPIIFILFFVLPAWIVLKLYDIKIKNKKSPLNIELLRSPGQTLQDKIEEITGDILANLAIAPIIPIFLYATALSNYAFSKNKLSYFALSLFVIGSIFVTAYWCYRIYKLLNKRNLLRLGYECEVAVGQDLQKLVSEKFNVFHDFPANKFNIDHVAVGPTGVFAIETKGRSKTVKKENDNWKVEFDGEKLIFPGWVEKKPIEQAKSQAVWLKKWVKEATCESVPVAPVLALPGWYIVRRTKSNLYIYNGKNSSFLAKGAPVLTEKQIQTISFQIEKECRDVKSIAYNHGPTSQFT